MSDNRVNVDSDERDTPSFVQYLNESYKDVVLVESFSSDKKLIEKENRWNFFVQTKKF